MRVYLAGPDVFLPAPFERAGVLRALAATAGLDAVSPLDPVPGIEGDTAAAIARRCEAAILACDAVLANLTPFRGASADAGTVFEVGYARALGKLIVGWSNEARDYEMRVPAATPGHDEEGLAIETFGLADNLMIACGIAASGGVIVRRAASRRWEALGAFEEAASVLARLLHTRVHKA